MKFNFKSLPELLNHFQDEQTCLDYLAEQRWGSQPACVKCGNVSDPIWKIEGGKRYKCSACKEKFSVTVGTVFENCKIRKSHVFAAIYLAANSKKGISSIQLGKHLGITQKSAWLLLHKVREMFRDKSPQMLVGAVEADETAVGGKEKNKHQSKSAKEKRLKKLGLEKLPRGTQAGSKTIVFGLLQRDGKVVNHIVKDAEAQTLLPIIAKQVEEGSTVFTDGLSIYKNVIALGYGHEAVSHNEGEYVRGQAHTCTIDGYWSLLKRGIVGIYHYVSPKHLHRYCDEFAYRYNTRSTQDQERFFNSLTVVDGKLTYKQLVNNER